MKYNIETCTEEDADYIEEKLDAINHSIVPPEEGAEDDDIVFKIADDEGNTIAGCILEIGSWKIAELDMIWVDGKHRRKGLGSALIREAEKAARERGCYVMILGTFDFQAIEPIDVRYDVDVVIRKIDTLNYPESEIVKNWFYGL